MSTLKARVLSKETCYTGRRFNVIEERLALSGEGSETKTTTHATVEHPGAVVILPKYEDGSFGLIEQYRHSIQKSILEVPAGTLEKDEEPLECAKRELAEEMKLGAKVWTSLGTLYPTPGFCSEIQYCFLAEDLYPNSKEGDEDEIITIRKFSEAELLSAIQNQEILDAKSLALFCRLFVIKMKEI